MSDQYIVQCKQCGREVDVVADAHQEVQETDNFVCNVCAEVQNYDSYVAEKSALDQDPVAKEQLAARYAFIAQRIGMIDQYRAQLAAARQDEQVTESTGETEAEPVI